MFSHFLSTSRPLWQNAFRVAMGSAAALAACTVQAVSLTVLLADDSVPHAEFVQQLRETRDAGSRLEIERMGVRTHAASSPSGDPPAAEEERANAGVRTRSARTNSTGVEHAVTIAVGAAASRAAIDRPGNEPLLLAMLTRLDYESLRVQPAFRRTERRVGVLLRDPAMADQLTLIDAVLPRKRRLGVVATAESEPLLRELQRAGAGWRLQIEYAPDATSLATGLRAVLPRSDALLVLPDLIGDDQAGTLAVLRAAAGAGVPVFGASEGLVRSGGLAAAVSTPSQLAQQARGLLQKLSTGAQPGVLVEAAAPATVRVNTTVARGLGLRLPDERELTERVTTVR